MQHIFFSSTMSFYNEKVHRSLLDFSKRKPQGNSIISLAYLIKHFLKTYLDIFGTFEATISCITHAIPALVSLGQQTSHSLCFISRNAFYFSH